MNIERYDDYTQSLINKCLEQQKSSDKEALQTLYILEKVAREKNDEFLMGFTNYYLASTYYTHQMDYMQFRRYLEEAIRHLLKSDDQELLARAYNFVGIDACNNGSYDISYYYYMLGLQACEGLNNTYLESILYSNTGHLYERLGRYDLARKYCRMGMDVGEGHEDDLYYFHNLINGVYMDGILSVRMGDLEQAKKDVALIIELGKDHMDDEGMEVVFMGVMFLRVQLAYIEGDMDKYRVLLEKTLDDLRKTKMIYDFIDDIHMFCKFLIEHDELEPVKNMLDMLGEVVEPTQVVQMMKIKNLIEMEYLKKIGDEEGFCEILKKQHELSIRQEQEQTKLYLYSIDLIDMMEELRRDRQKVKEENEALRLQATTDALTGIPNRLALDKSIEEGFRKAVLADTTFCIEMMDIDFFKDYNDMYGHNEGDVCLRKIAEEISKVAEDPRITCGRYGGDEFTLIYENMTDEEVLKVATELEKRIAKLDIPNSKSKVASHVTISQGICNAMPRMRMNPGDILVEADNALYDVKREESGGGRIRLSKKV